MKKNMRRLMALSLAAALALTALTGCGGNASSSDAMSVSTGTLAQEKTSARVGTILLSVNPEIEMDYDDGGNVVALNALNDDGRTVLAGYTGYEGRPCTAVVGELVDEIHAAGYFDTTVGGHERNIVLKLERGSAYPTDHFLDDLATSVRIAVETDQIGSQAVTLGQDDYDDTYGDKGYINACSSAESGIRSGRPQRCAVRRERLRPGRWGLRSGVRPGWGGIRVRGGRLHRKGEGGRH